MLPEGKAPRNYTDYFNHLLNIVARYENTKIFNWCTVQKIQFYSELLLYIITDIQTKLFS